MEGTPSLLGVNGERTVAELATATLEAFDRTLAAIRLIDGIASTETSILLSSRKVAGA